MRPRRRLFRPARASLAASALSALAIAATALSAAPADAAEFTTFGSTLIYLDDSVVPSNITCYLTNLGGKPARVKDLRIFTRSSRKFPSANTCGSLAGFDLAPRSTCYIGFNPTQPLDIGHGCAALVEKGSALRGEIELRDAGTRARSSAELTVAAGGDSATEFRPIASPPMFGAADQTNATCLFTNLGATNARVRNYTVQLADGSTIAPRPFNCTPADEVVVPPGQTCSFSATVPVGTVQCRAQVSRRSNIRAAFGVVKPPATILNFLPME